MNTSTATRQTPPRSGARDQDGAGLLDTAATTFSNVASEMSMTLDSASELARAVGRLADRQVRDRPWQVALIAGVIGLLAGLSLRRR